MEKLSVAIITKNNEKDIGRCLESLKWADEIVVLDGHSTDRTLEICREYTDRIFQKDFESFPIERDWVLQKTQHTWVLAVDADMVFPDAFRNEVQKILTEPQFDGYRFRLLTVFLGKEIRHCGWYDYRYLRLFNKEKGGYDLNLTILDPFVVKTGRIGKLHAHVLHYQGDSFLDYFGKIKRYSHLTALEYGKKGIRITGTRSLYYLLLKPVLVFLHKYVWKMGFLDGVAGLIVSFNSSISYYSSYAALWDIQRKEGR